MRTTIGVGRGIACLAVMLACISAPPACAQGGTWTTQVLTAPSWFADVHAVSDQVVWAGGDGGVVMRTVDGGADWELLSAPTPHQITTLYAFDATTCVVATGSGLFFRTSDGGASWDQVHDAGTWINCLHFFDAQRGWAVGDPQGGFYVMAESTDGGVTWAAVTGPPEAGYGITRSFDWIDDQIGVFGTTQTGVIWRTTDGGAEWHQALSHLNQVICVQIDPSGIGLAGGDLSALDRSTDGGATWEASLPPTSSRLTALEWVEGTSKVWAGAGQNDVYLSTDAGLDWETYTLPTASHYVENMDFASPTAGWCVGHAPPFGPGAIWKYEEPVTAVSEVTITPAESRLHVRSFPQPFRSQVAFGVEVATEGPVSIVIHDVQGRRVAALGPVMTTPGTLGLRWDGRDDTGRAVPSGTYYYRVSAPGGEATERLTRVR